MLSWELTDSPSAADAEAVEHGVFSHGRALAQGGDARNIACFVRDSGVVVAGGTGRTEFARLFVSYLWVAESHRGKGLSSQILAHLERGAVERGCSSSLIETLSDKVARLYEAQGYEVVAFVRSYVGPFNRTILLKRLEHIQPSSGA